MKKKKLTVGIIGGGIAGLSAAYFIDKQKYHVTLLESGKKIGGLASGFKYYKWRWVLENHYHHWFTSDFQVINLSKKLGQKIVFSKPKTSLFYNGKTYQFDNPTSLIKFPHLSIIDRFRTGALILYIKTITNWKTLESISAKKFIIKFTGRKSWNVLWDPLFNSKFRGKINEIPMSWFWARIRKRSTYLGYPIGGFYNFISLLTKKLLLQKVIIKTKIEVFKIIRKGDKLSVIENNNIEKFDYVISTIPFSQFLKITKGLPEKYKTKLSKFDGVGAINLVLSMKTKFLKDGTYWLNINDSSFPFLSVVEHTNFVDSKFYNEDSIVYIGNYLPNNHNYFNLSARELIKIYMPYLQTINNEFNYKSIKKFWVFKSKFAQPLITLGYSKKIPDYETPIKNLFIANMQMIYPWDRGTNYAVSIGKKVAEIINNR